MGIGKQPPLLFAALLHKTAAVEALLKRKANPNIMYENQPLIRYLVKRLDLTVVSLLIKYGANFDETIDDASGNKQDVIIYLFNKSMFNFSFTKELINRGYKLDKILISKDLKQNIWYRALNEYRQDVVQFLLDNGANPNQLFVLPNGHTVTPIMIIIQLLLDSKKPIDQSNSREYLKLIEMLLQAGADINQVATPDGKPQSPLSYALVKAFSYESPEEGLPKIKVSNMFLIRYLVNQKSSIDQAIDLYLKNGYSPNDYVIGAKLKMDVKGSRKKISSVTLLRWATDANKIESVNLLLKSGANANDGSLQSAISNSYGDIMELLIQFGAKIL